MKNLIIFGTGKISEAVSYYFKREGEWNITGYIVDDNYIKNSVFLEKPVIPISKFEGMFDKNDFFIFVALGYQSMNKLRKTKYEYFKNLGYSFANYISPFVKGNFDIGENSIVMDGAVIQPYAKIGNDVLVWGGTMIGHHAIIEDHCWLTGGCLIGGISKIGQSTFVGLGAVVGHEIIIGEKCMLGAGTLTSRSLKEGTVLVEPNTEPHRLNSEQFTRMSTCFRT